MRRTIVLYGICLAGLVLLLKVIEYRFFVHELSLEIYLGIIALLFTGVGIWAGLKLVNKTVVVVNEKPFSRNETEIKKRGISPRELEVLEKIAAGLSNKEIADQLFVSLNTIKTHTANIYVKLDAKRRTQAIQRAKELQFIR